MRVVVASECSRDLRQAELDRHLQMMSRFVAGAQSESLPADRRCLTLIVRSASSDAAQALIGMKDDLARVGLSAKAILARLEPEDDLRQLFASLSELNPSEPANSIIRWARNPRLLDAHEQVTDGASICWSGDAMRRDAGKRNTLTLFNEGAPEAARLGRLAFEALWVASTEVPRARIIGPSVSRPSGGYQKLAEAPATVSPLRPSPQSWPLVRH